MKKFKVTKKVMALALCVVMCMASVLSVSAYSSTRYITNPINGVLYSKVYLNSSDSKFSIEMEPERGYAGRNLYTTSCLTYVTVHDSVDKCYNTYKYMQTVFSGQTSNLLIKKSYTNHRVLYFTFWATANGKEIADTIYN